MPPINSISNRKIQMNVVERNTVHGHSVFLPQENTITIIENFSIPFQNILDIEQYIEFVSALNIHIEKNSIDSLHSIDLSLRGIKKKIEALEGEKNLNKLRHEMTRECREKFQYLFYNTLEENKYSAAEKLLKYTSTLYDLFLLSEHDVQKALHEFNYHPELVLYVAKSSKSFELPTEYANFVAYKVLIRKDPDKIIHFFQNDMKVLEKLNDQVLIQYLVLFLRKKHHEYNLVIENLTQKLSPIARGLLRHF
jgi:hypothetical protein